MQVTYSVIFTLVCLATINALPTSTDDRKGSKDEYEIVPLEMQPHFRQPIVDTGAGFGVPFSNPFGGFFENFEDIMNRMRQQTENLLKRFHFGRHNNSSEEPDLGFGYGFPRFPNIDLGKGNTTSVTKVIDGHKVVINETEYNKSDDFGGAFFKVRIIDVKPNSNESTESSEVTTGKSTLETSTKFTEPLDKGSIENEIPDGGEALSSNNIETFDEVDDIMPSTQNAALRKSNNIEWSDVEPLEAFEDNSVYPARDLSRDVYVNELLADGGAPTNPDAEVFYVNPTNVDGKLKNYKPVFNERMIDPR